MVRDHKDQQDLKVPKVLKVLIQGLKDQQDHKELKDQQDHKELKVVRDHKVQQVLLELKERKVPIQVLKVL